MSRFGVGENLINVDGVEKVTGRAKYCIDMEFPRMLWAKIKRSTYPHAKIVHIDTSAAEALPGVEAVLTYKDVPNTRHGVGLADEPIIARDKVRFIGEAVAAVAAKTEAIAEEAVDLIKVEYEELPALFDPEISMRPDPPVIIHEDLPNYKRLPILAPTMDQERPNVLNVFRIIHGDINKGFAEADHVFEGRYYTPMKQHVQMEPHNCVAMWDEEGRLIVWTSSQSPYMTLHQLCEAFDLPPSKVRIICPKHVGGGFGGKIEITSEAICAALSKKCGNRPVKLRYTREEVFTSATVRHPVICYLKTGVKNDGTIVAQEWKIVMDSGAYARIGFLTLRNACYAPCGSYKIPHFRLEAMAAYTNKPVGGAYRGFGNNQLFWAQETQIDEICEKLGFDPVEFRLKNLLEEGDVNVMNEIMHSVGSKECVRKVAERLDWANRHKRKSSDKGPWRTGVGLAYGNKYSVAPTASCAVVKINEDETIEIRQSGMDLGQGIHTVVTQMACEVFKVQPDKVRVVGADTDVTPYDQLTGSSRLTFNVGNAVKRALEEARDNMFKMAAKKLEADPGDLDTEDGKIFVKGVPAKSIRINDLFQDMVLTRRFMPEGGELLGKATWITPVDKLDPETGQCPDDGYRRACSFYIHGCHGAEVEVNVETGEVRLKKYVMAHDVGKAINPKMCEGQMEAALSAGVGSVLLEEMILEEGRVLNPNLADYKIFTAADLPSVNDTHAIIVEAPQFDGPWGAKGLGEGVLTPSAPAVAAAIHDAVGVRLHEIPWTPERILAALKGKRD